MAARMRMILPAVWPTAARDRRRQTPWIECRRTSVDPSITVEMAKGFTLYMLKAVMGGRGDDLIDLAKANLWE